MNRNKNNEEESKTDYIGLNTDENYEKLYEKNKISNRRIIEKERKNKKKKDS